MPDTLAYRDLTDTEMDFLRFVQRGEVWEAPGESTGLSTGEMVKTDDRRTLRASLVSHLLKGGEVTLPDGRNFVLERTLRITGADLVGRFAIDGDIAVNIDFERCSFKESVLPVDLNNSALLQVRMLDCEFPVGLMARSSTCEGSLDVRYSRFRGSVDLSFIHVNGSVLLDGIDADADLPIGVLLPAAHITGILGLSGARIYGGVACNGATVGSSMNLDGARFSAPGYAALNAEGIRLQGSVFGRMGMATDGYASFRNARIGGDLCLNSASLSNDGLIALDLIGCSIDGDLLLSASFSANGSIVERGVPTGGSVILNGARLESGSDRALSLDRCKIGGSLLMRSKFWADGAISIVDGVIGGEWSLETCMLFTMGDYAILAERVTIGTSFFFRSSSISTGGINLAMAKAGTDVQFRGCMVYGLGEAAIVLSGLRSPRLEFTPAQIAGSVDLRGVVVDHFIEGADDNSFAYYLSGFKYANLRPQVTLSNVARRLAWLSRDPSGYDVSSYSQLAGVLSARGELEAARKVQVKSQAERRSRGSLIWKPSRLAWSFILRSTIGYGYNPALAVLWLIFVILLGGYSLDRFPSETFVTAATNAPTFNPWLYSLDAAVPFLDLGYSVYRLAGAAQYLALGITILGYFLASAFLAALAIVFRRGA